MVFLSLGHVKPYQAKGFEKIFEIFVGRLMRILRINGNTLNGVRFAKLFQPNFKNIISSKSFIWTCFHPRLIWRYSSTFSKLEPLALVWIDSLNAEDVVYDIGANVGVFACAICKLRQSFVVAIEIDPINYSVLASNVVKNNLSRHIISIPLGIWDATGLQNIHYRSLSPGDALQGVNRLSQFVESTTEPAHVLCQAVISPSCLIENITLPKPTAIKLDIDGSEFKILSSFALWKCADRLP